MVDPEIRRRWYDVHRRPAWPAPITTASHACTVVQQRTGTEYAAPPTGADDTPYRLELVVQGVQDPAVRLRVRLLVAGFGGIEDAEDALDGLARQTVAETITLGSKMALTRWTCAHTSRRAVP